MSRVGKVPITVPQGVNVVLSEENHVKVTGHNGSLERKFPKFVEITIGSDSVLVKPNGDSKEARSSWGLVRTLISNMVIGVSQGYEKTLELHGTGYNVAVQGNDVRIFVGYSHDIFYRLPKGITADASKPRVLVIKGFDKELVGQVSAHIRALRPPEPYKGKGVRYSDEKVRIKECKKK